MLKNDNTQYLKVCKKEKQASLVAQSVKSLPAMQETWVRSLGQKDPLEKGMATHSRKTNYNTILGYLKCINVHNFQEGIWAILKDSL